MLRSPISALHVRTILRIACLPVAFALMLVSTLRHQALRVLLLGLTVSSVLFGGSYLVSEAATAPTLGTASSFAVLGGSTVTNTRATVVNGNLGVSPGSAVTGFPPGVDNGVIHAADATAAQAQNDTTTAYNNLAGQTCNTNETGNDLGGMSLTTGVYCFSSSAQLTGTLTLNGTASSVFVFQIGSTLTTASGSSVALSGVSPCNVFWQVGSSATLGTTTSFQGNILALTSITLNHGATDTGRTLARNGAVTMDTNTVDSSGCGGSVATATPMATATAAAQATATAAAQATATAAAQATATAAAQATATRAAVATATTTAGSSGGGVGPIATSTPVPTSTTAAGSSGGGVGPIATSTPVPTSTPAALATSTPVRVVTPAATPILAAQGTATTAAAATAVNAVQGTATPVALVATATATALPTRPVVPELPNTGSEPNQSMADLLVLLGALCIAGGGVVAGRRFQARRGSAPQPPP